MKAKSLAWEFRAVFSYPPSILGDTADDYGPWRKDILATQKDYCYRPEESHGWRSGTQRRLVSAVEPLDENSIPQEWIAVRA